MFSMEACRLKRGPRFGLISMHPLARSAVIVGRSCLLREGVSRILETAGVQVVGSAKDVRDVAPASPEHEQTLAVFINSSESGIDDIADQVAAFKQRHTAGRVVVLADKRNAGNILQAFRTGANAYLGTEVPADTFLKVIELVMLGKTILPLELLSLWGSAVSGSDQRHAPQATALRRSLSTQSGGCLPLSSREHCILRNLVEGASNKVIARRMDITEATVKAHVKAILRKIRVSNRTQAAIWALANPSRAIFS